MINTKVSGLQPIQGLAMREKFWRHETQLGCVLMNIGLFVQKQRVICCKQTWLQQLSKSFVWTNVKLEKKNQF